MSESAVFEGSLGLGVLIARLLLGLGIASHGAQKLFGWFGGHGLRGTAAHLESIGFRPGPLFAGLAGFGEFGGGVLVALGFLGPIGPALVLVVMVVARVAHRGRGFFATGNGVELAVVYAAGTAVFAFTGYGAYSVDAWLGVLAPWTPGRVWTALALAFVVGLGVPMIR
jgi:putative oxidoreductase